MPDVHPFPEAAAAGPTGGGAAVGDGVLVVRAGRPRGAVASLGPLGELLINYSQTYQDDLSTATITGPLSGLTATAVRRRFTHSMLRSGRMPSIVQNDNGKDLRNALMNEFKVLLSYRNWFIQ